MSPALNPIIVEELKAWAPCIPLDDLLSIFEVEETIKSMSNRKAVGPDELPVELLKLKLGTVSYTHLTLPTKA